MIRRFFNHPLTFVACAVVTAALLATRPIPPVSCTSLGPCEGPAGEDCGCESAGCQMPCTYCCEEVPCPIGNPTTKR